MGGKNQHGFTLVEIMLAVTLSLILIAGVIQVYLSSKTSFTVQNQLARLQENQRVSVEFLQRDIRQAGFNVGGNTPIITVTEGVGTSPDSITVRLASNTDCLGAATPNGIAVNTYSISNTRQLMCTGNGNPLAPQPIADGVRNMQILLGVKSPTASNESVYAMQTPYADSYVNSSSVTNFNRVASVRIAILTDSASEIKSQNTTQTFTLLDQAITLTDRFKHQVITTTIPLRNTPLPRERAI